MANPNPQNKFKKGNKFGKGRPEGIKELKEARSLNKAAHDKAINKYMHMSISELKELTKDPNLSALDAMIISAINRAIKKQCVTAQDYLVSRLIGRIPQKQEHSGGILTGHAALMQAMKDIEGEDSNEQ